MFGSGLLDQGAASGKLMSGSSAYRRDGFQRHVAGALDGPLVILFEEQRADEADDGLAVWEDADDLGAALGVGSARPDHLFVEEIAAALRRAHGDSRAGAKTVAAWTGANETTAKNWFSGTYGSSGAHLVALARHSEEVLGTFLAMAGRDELMVAIKLVAAEQAIAELLDAVRRLGGDQHH